MTAQIAVLAAAFAVVLGAGTVGRASAAAQAPAPARIEARSAHFLVVAVVRSDAMTAHLSRLADNTPVADAVVTALLRGKEYPLTAQADGGYALRSRALTLPGPAVVAFKVVEAGVSERLAGTLQIAAAAGRTGEQSGTRQLGWWVLNFGVCIGFLVLIARRRKGAKPADP